MRTLPALASLLSFATVACASSGGGHAATPQDQSVIVRGSRESLGINTRRETDVRVDTLEASAQRVFALLPSVLATLNLKSATIDSSTLNVTSASTQFRRTFDGERISHFLSCGSSALGNNADLYTINIRVQSWVERAGDSASTLRTAVRASAIPADNGAGNAVVCASTGRIEARVRQLTAVAVYSKR